jgi:short-subunit dehydrogenase involved in D-alanine esterification of teichoic acids
MHPNSILGVCFDGFRMCNAALHQGASLDGQVILIVQRSWLIASNLADAFEEKGALVILSKTSASRLADIPGLCAAVVDSHSRELCRLLEAKLIPFVLYTAGEQSEDEFPEAPIVRKPAPVAEVVTRLEQLLT